MNERIKQLRKELGLTQSQFGSKIGLKGNTITNYESSLRSPSDSVILSICREFQANEQWLRTGVGDMFIKKSRDQEIAAFMGNVLKGEPDFRRRFIAVLSRMSVEEWELLEKKIKEIAIEP